VFLSTSTNCVSLHWPEVGLWQWLASASFVEVRFVIGDLVIREGGSKALDLQANLRGGDDSDVEMKRMRESEDDSELTGDVEEQPLTSQVSFAAVSR